MTKLKLAFAGTPDFAKVILEALIAEPDFNVVAVITQPDMPQGRKLTPTAPPVKALAQRFNLPCYQPQHIKQIYTALQELDLDLLIVAAYAQLVPKEILQLPKLGCLNVHGSLLPKYRGASVIQAALINGDRETGISIIEMVEKLDAGAVLSQATLTIDPSDTTGTLSDRLAILGATTLVDTIKDYAKRNIEPQAQDEALVSYCPRLSKADGLLDWNKSAVELERFIRAMNPWPSAWTWLNGKQLKIISVKCIDGLDLHKPGKVFIYNNTLAIQTGQGALSVNQIQPEGKKVLSGQEFANGYHEAIGQILG